MNTLTISTLRLLVEAYATETSIKPATALRHAGGDARFFEAAESGRSITERKLREIMDWFLANWPDDADRPQALDDYAALRQWEAAHDYAVTDPACWPRVRVPETAADTATEATETA